ncbi:hypothetical protein [Gordonibacter sp.]|uniref:hypothetical protein n=1 Tax=Gordonibacter sp. TaxID=1968902 RepID=UPI002FC9807C
MKVFELMAALSYRPAGDEVVLYGYGDECNADIEVIDYDRHGRVAISSNRSAFEEYDKKQYGNPDTCGDA